MIWLRCLICWQIRLVALVKITMGLLFMKRVSKPYPWLRRKKPSSIFRHKNQMRDLRMWINILSCSISISYTTFLHRQYPPSRNPSEPRLLPHPLHDLPKRIFPQTPAPTPTTLLQLPPSRHSVACPPPSETQPSSASRLVLGASPCRRCSRECGRARARPSAVERWVGLERSIRASYTSFAG